MHREKKPPNHIELAISKKYRTYYTKVRLFCYCCEQRVPVYKPYLLVYLFVRIVIIVQ